ncbi:hypothetical protein H0A36_17625 [Endozoicomonas sp. SM1973]|uniref:Uncharacterized protein n=1 Tax=Spartinivicinus marinus TaxID=2994442 RepID=A0A853IEA6_9GAMM|nr:hypothetical protein [Spartinivicinus marinus]MCX4030194.1 hypothetical protein [Spartinivicinus marinus]NYZ67837.1 hypothetical protein [Spartinivicinus marinus]
MYFAVKAYSYSDDELYVFEFNAYAEALAWYQECELSWGDKVSIEKRQGEQNIPVFLVDTESSPSLVLDFEAAIMLADNDYSKVRFDGYMSIPSNTEVLAYKHKRKQAYKKRHDKSGMSTLNR